MNSSPLALLLWCCGSAAALASAKPTALAAPDSTLTVVEDLGGASTLPYYRALNLLPSRTEPSLSLLPPQLPRSKADEAALLPVHSTLLTPGPVRRRVIRAPGLTPFFLIGDDPRSRAWITQHRDTLQRLGAVGFVVQVGSIEALSSLRVLARGLTLVPASADDLARRLGLTHYPTLVSATGIE